MKKLMTTVSAVALAFGLYATDTGTSFEGLAAGDMDPYNITATTGELTAQEEGQTYWVTNGTETLTVVEGTSLEQNNQRPSQYKDADQYKYLSIKTTLGNPVTRNVSVGGAGTSIGTGFYFDSLVKFTAFDEDPAINLNGGKLAVWLKENLNANDEPVSTNLVITAGFLDANLQAKAYTTNYVCTVPDVNLNDGAWHRVTVKAIDSIYKAGIAAVPGFVVFIDKNQVKCFDAKGIINKSSLTDNAYVLDSAGALFPSADQLSADKLNINAVQFDGQGDVDDLVFTSTVPFDEAKDAEFFAINLGEHVTGVQGYINLTEFNISAATSIVWAASQTVTITGVTCENGWMEGSVTNQAGTAVSGAYTTTAGGSITVNAKKLGATLTDAATGNPVGDGTYETLAAAQTAINGLASGNVKLTLNDAATTGFSLANANVSVVLDLAGNNLSAATGSEVVFVDSGSTLLITNSTESVGHVAASGSGQSAVFAYGNVTIAGGYYDGLVDFSQVDVSAQALVTGGKFSVNENKDPQSLTEPPAVNADLKAAAAAAGNDLVVGSGSASYYEVVEKVVTYVAQIEGGDSYETLKAAVDAATAGATVTVLADCVVDEPITFNYGINLVNNYEVTLSAAYALRLANGTTTPVTVSGTGAFISTGTGSPFLVGCNEAKSTYGIDSTFAGSMVLSSGTIRRNDGSNNMVKLEYGTFVMNGGSLLGGSRGVKADADVGSFTSTLTINGGVISNGVSAAVAASAESGTATVTINGGDIIGPITCSQKNTGTATLTIPGTSTARFDRDQTAFCASGYATTQSGDWYVVGLATYTITFVAGDNASVTPASTNYTINSGMIVLPTPQLNGGAVGPMFDGWTNETYTTAIKEFTPAAANLGNFTLYAKWTAGGPTYPTYLDNADEGVKAQYLTWAQTYGADKNSVYEDAFLLNVAPDTTGATIDATAVSISGTTVTIDINRGNLNGVPYVKKASTVAGLATAPQTAITIVPADQVQDLDNGGRVTLENESGTAQFYQIGVQSTPLNQN